MATDAYLVKGAVVRAHLDYLDQTGQRQAVFDRLTPASRAALDPPPLSGTWSEAGPLVEMTRVVLDLGGDAGVLDMARAVLASRSTSSLIPMVQGVLRVFGASPATIYGRFNDLVQTSIRGVRFEFRADGEHGGVMTMEHLGSLQLHRGSFLTTLPGLELVLQLCGRKGVVDKPVVLGPHRATFRITW